MQIPLPVFSAQGLDGLKKYIAASDSYLESKAHRRTMEFEFPDIQKQCPLCARSGCARWKGYYRRHVQDVALSFAGLLAIRYGRCRSLKSEFSFLPDFLIPRRRITIPTLALVGNALCDSASMTIQSAIDQVLAPEEESVVLSVSTVHTSLQNMAWIVKSGYIRFGISRRRRRLLSEPESYGSLLLSSIMKFLNLAKQPITRSP